VLTILKHAKNFVGDGAEKPVFKGIHFTGGEIAVSNTHVLVFRTNYPSEKKTIHWKTGAPIAEVYPDVAKCIPLNSQIKFEFMDLNSWIHSLKICVLVNKGSDICPCSLESYGDDLNLKSKWCGHSYSSAHKFNLVKGPLLESISFNAKYLHDVLVFFKDSGVTIVTMGFNTALTPITLTTDKDVLAVLTPIRGNA